MFLTNVLSKRSGRPEQLAKMGEKYDLFRINQAFLGHLEKEEQIWIPIWIKW